MFHIEIAKLSYWTSDKTYTRLMNYGLPVLGLIAGVTGTPLLALLMFAFPAALLAPPIWSIRRYWRVLLGNRINLPRAMIFASVGTLTLFAAGSLFTFHLLGAVILGVLSRQESGLSADQLLPYGFLSCSAFIAFRLLRRWTLGKMPMWIAESDRIRADMSAEIARRLDPRLLQQTLGMGRPN